jgi:hypothetical protein
MSSGLEALITPFAQQAGSMTASVLFRVAIRLSLVSVGGSIEIVFTQLTKTHVLTPRMRRHHVMVVASSSTMSSEVF